jgi:hypothetical protein
VAVVAVLKIFDNVPPEVDIRLFRLGLGEIAVFEILDLRNDSGVMNDNSEGFSNSSTTIGGTEARLTQWLWSFSYTERCIGWYF